MLWLRMK